MSRDREVRAWGVTGQSAAPWRRWEHSVAEVRVRLVAPVRYHRQADSWTTDLIQAQPDALAVSPGRESRPQADLLVLD